MMDLKSIRATILALFCAVILAAPAAEAQAPAQNPRIALVVGNATYRDAALATTANDAGLVAQTLQAAGFDVVGARDLDGQSLRTTLRDFLGKAAAAGPDMQAFVYLAGRAIQYNGDNYFVPIDAQINRDADVPIEAVRIADFAHALAETPGRARIIVLDAARANPYTVQGAPLAPGLALVDPEPGELIAFNATPGALAGDEQGPYGVYGKTLAGAMRQGGVDIAEVFDQTRVLVNGATQGALLPWSASKLGGPYFVFERAADAPPPPVVSAAEMARRPIARLSVREAYAVALQRDTIEGYHEFLAAFPHSDQARRVRAILAVRREAAFWRRTVSLNTPRAYWTYLRAYPRGPHVGDAGRRLAILSAEFEPPPDFRPEVFVGLPPPPPDERFYEEQPVYAFEDLGPPPPPPPPEFYYVEDDDWRDLPPPPPPVAVGVLPVLGIAIPIVLGAVAYHGHGHHDGIAPRDAPRLPPPPLAPPPMPANIKPVIPPPPTPAAGAGRNMAVVKPLPPIAPPPPAPGAQPAAIPAPPAGANPPAAAPLVPGAKPLPVPPSPNVGKLPAAAPTAPPGPAGTKPAGRAAPAPVAKPLPFPAAPATGANAPAAAPLAPAGKPLPVPPPPNAGNPALAPAAPSSAKPSGAPPPAILAPMIAPASPGGKPPPTPTAPTGVNPSPVTASPPNAVLKPVPKTQTLAPVQPPPPAVHAPPPVVSAPPPPPVVHAPPPPLVAAPRPPPPAPVVHAPPPPPPAVHAPVKPPPACGTAGLPPCPK